MRLLPIILFLVGCPSPTPDATTTPGGPPQGTPPPGEPGAQPPAGEQGGTPGAAPTAPPEGAPAGGSLPKLQVAPGTGVTLSGKLAYAGKATGTVRIDIVQPKAEGGATVLHAVELDKLGEFSIEVPKSTGKIVVNAFVDAGGDGPSPGEPTAHTEEIDVQAANVTDISLTLLDEAPGAKSGGPDNSLMGPANPGGVAPAGEAGGAPGGKPGEGGAPPAVPPTAPPAPNP